jgi:RNA:NAD 2'-phosphotransferase (TPT1/KptA family)
LGLAVDSGGFVPVEQVAEVSNLSPDQVSAIAGHPGEPRFEIADGRIRALYGHSFPVPDLPNLEVVPPKLLFHGTSWEVVDAILGEGLSPMGRQKVHLTNNPSEALEVARRRQLPALLAIPSRQVPGLQAVADAVWAGDFVPRQFLEVRNAFAALTVPAAWLRASLLRDGD